MVGKNQKHDSPLWLELNVLGFVTVEGSLRGIEPELVESTPDAIRAKGVDPNMLYGWRENGLAGMMLRGTCVAWKVYEFPAAEFSRWVGKGGSWAEANLCRRQIDGEGKIYWPPLVFLTGSSPSGDWQDTSSFNELSRIFKTMSPLFPDGVKKWPGFNSDA